MKRAFLAFVLPAFAALGMAQDNFPEVPDNNWAFDTFKAMKSVGISAMPSGHMMAQPPHERMDMAKYTATAVLALPSLVDIFQSSAFDGPRPAHAGYNWVPTQTEAIDGAILLLDHASDLKRLVNVFELEIHRQGIDPLSLKKTLSEELSKLQSMVDDPRIRHLVPFEDVPHNHWAYDALLELRREGIIVGYPEHRFAG